MSLNPCVLTTPPESVSTTSQRSMSAQKAPYSSGSHQMTLAWPSICGRRSWRTLGLR